MSDREALLQAIIESPEDDAPRLIYADWLEERGESAHAELIRVQCERARCQNDSERNQLLRREAGLLENPVFWPTAYDLQNSRYRRGFVECVPCRLSVWYFASEPGAPSDKPFPFHLPLDKALTLDLTIRDGLLDELACSRLSHSPWLSRVESLSFIGCDVSPPAAAILAASRFLGMRVLQFVNRRTPIETIRALTFAPAVRNLTRLTITGALTAGHPKAVLVDAGGAPVDEFVWDIAHSEKMSSLESLGLCNSGIGNAAALALAESPFLNRLTEVRLGLVPNPPREGWRALVSRPGLRLRYGTPLDAV